MITLANRTSSCIAYYIVELMLPKNFFMFGNWCLHVVCQNKPVGMTVKLT